MPVTAEVVRDSTAPRKDPTFPCVALSFKPPCFSDLFGAKLSGAGELGEHECVFCYMAK